MQARKKAYKKHRAMQKRVMKYGLVASFALLVMAVAMGSMFFGFVAVMSATIHTITK